MILFKFMKMVKPWNENEPNVSLTNNWPTPAIFFVVTVKST
jgi:hypothetical protein